MTADNIRSFFHETHVCRPGAKGCWRPGEELFAEFAAWHGGELYPTACFRFYGYMSQLGFEQRNRERVYFFVPRKIEVTS